MLGRHFLFVLIFEWLTLKPVVLAFPQITQTFAISLNPPSLRAVPQRIFYHSFSSRTRKYCEENGKVVVILPLKQVRLLAGSFERSVFNK